MVQPEHEAGARAVLERFRQAAISQSAEDMRRVYAVDAVHEFPFTRPGVPSRLEGRDVIVNWIAQGWAANPLRYERYRTLAIHDTTDPETIVVEQEALGTSALRDYVNILGRRCRHGPRSVREMRQSSVRISVLAMPARTNTAPSSMSATLIAAPPPREPGPATSSPTSMLAPPMTRACTTVRNRRRLCPTRLLNNIAAVGERRRDEHGRGEGRQPGFDAAQLGEDADAVEIDDHGSVDERAARAHDRHDEPLEVADAFRRRAHAGGSFPMRHGARVCRALVGRWSAAGGHARGRDAVQVAIDHFASPSATVASA